MDRGPENRLIDDPGNRTCCVSGTFYRDGDRVCYNPCILPQKEKRGKRGEPIKMEKTLEKQRLIEEIEAARKKLNDSIDAKKDYDTIYQYSVELDHLIEQYIVAGF